MKLPPLLISIVVCAAAIAAPAQRYAAPRFAESPAERESKARTVFADVDKVFNDFAAEKHTPGLVWGIVLDGKLVHTGATGFANVEKKIPAAAETRFRIASMSKSVTALAIMKLRDAGKLSLADPVEKFLPEFRAIGPLTVDSPPITIRHLLTMTPGFPEDNPWGDRQLAVGVKEFSEFIAGGVARANPPGVGFEYSNLAFALLGQIVAKASGTPYQRYITREILEPLGMGDTRYEFADVPPEKLALGYRRAGDGWQLEPLLHDGVYGAMGGILTTLPDFARYVSFHLAAYPPRDDADNSIVRRASVREMHQPGVISNVGTFKNAEGETIARASGYNFGLGWARDGRNIVSLSHGGGLPGFGSYYAFYPDHGFGVIAFANLTYAGPGGATFKAAALLLDKAKLAARELPVSAILQTRKQQVAELIQSWDAKLANALVAENFFPDRSREDWLKLSREMLAKLGAVKTIGEIVPENQLRGTFPIVGEKGRVDVFFTLTPEKSAKLQQLRLTFVPAKP
jgi:CubicO group peptidase (beta-lactamase class C family)